MVSGLNVAHGHNRSAGRQESSQIRSSLWTKAFDWLRGVFGLWRVDTEEANVFATTVNDDDERVAINDVVNICASW